MKKFLPRWAIKSFLLAAICISFSACGNSYVGTKAPSEIKKVGDIVFSDGSAIPSGSVASLTERQKKEAVAVIFYAPVAVKDISEQPLGERTLGIGIVHSKGSVAWCSSKAAAYNIRIEPLEVHPHGSAGKLTFGEDSCTDGSGSIEKMASFLGSTSDILPGDKSLSQLYPAFGFAENYFLNLPSKKGRRNFCKGWYLPSLPEMFCIWKEKETLNSALALAGGDTFSTESYWTSSQFPTKNNCAFILYMTDGDFGDYGGNKCLANYRTCAIREF